MYNKLILSILIKIRSGPGLTPVQPQGPVHSPPGPGPDKNGASPPSTGLDTQTQVHEGQDWTPDSLGGDVAWNWWPVIVVVVVNKYLINC